MRYLFLSIFSIITTVCFAESFSVDGLFYNTLIGKRVEICAPPSDGPRYSSRFQNGIINIPSEVNFNGDTYSVVQVGSYCFYGDTELRKVVLPSSIQIISRYAFGCCYYLESFSFPENLTTIGEYAFWLCASCDFSELPAKLETVGDYAFSQSSFDKVSFPDSLNSIGEFSFESIPTKYISIGKNLSSIGYGAFLHNSEIQTISVSPENLYFLSENDILFDKNKTTVLLAATDKTGCLDIPEGVLYTEYASFQNTKYTSIHIPYSLVTLGYESCSWMCNIQAAIIPAGNVDQTQFSGCEHLKTIVFGKEVNSIKKWCTNGCNNLETIYSLNNTPPSCPNDAFEDSHYLWTTLYVPSFSIEYYKSHETWGKFKNILTCDDYSYYAESLSLECPVAIKVGEECGINYSLLPSNTLISTLQWESSDNTVATITNGKLIGKRSGSVVISASTLDGSNLSISKSVTIVEDSGIESVISSNISISGHSGYIEILNGRGLCTVTSLSGSTIFSGYISDYTTSIKCECGVYIVKVGSLVTKISVR